MEAAGGGDGVATQRRKTKRKAQVSKVKLLAMMAERGRGLFPITTIEKKVGFF